MPSESTIWFRLIRTVEHRIKTKSEVFLSFSCTTRICHTFAKDPEYYFAWICNWYEFAAFIFLLWIVHIWHETVSPGLRPPNERGLEPWRTSTNARGKGQKQSPATERGKAKRGEARRGITVTTPSWPPPSLALFGAGGPLDAGNRNRQFDGKGDNGSSSQCADWIRRG